MADGVPDMDAAVMATKRGAALIAAMGAIGILGFVLLRPPAYVTAASSEFDDVASALAEHGTVLKALPSGTTLESVVETLIDASTAVDVAVKAFGKLDTPVVFEGLLSLTDHAPIVKDRPVYAVQLTGLSLPPLGGRGPHTEETMHHEMIVFVDATSGEFLVATTVR